MAPDTNRLLGPRPLSQIQRAAVWSRAPNVSLVFLRFMPDHTTLDDAFLLGWFAGSAKPSAFPKGLLTQIETRRAALLSSARHVELRTVYRLAVGLANPAPMENSGTSWNPTYGIPVIPGASLKGVVRHYLEEELAGGKDPAAVAAMDALPERDGGWSELLARCRGDEGGNVSVAALSELLFGGGGVQGNEGALVFFDAWPVLSRSQDGPFEVEVLTPHHREYYGDRAHVAADKDEPNPVHFLCIRRGVRFDLAVGLSRSGRTLDATAGEQAVELGLRLLEEALERWGVGAKTGAGYGRLAKKIAATAPKARKKPSVTQTGGGGHGQAQPAQPQPPPAAPAPVDVGALAARLAAAAGQGLDVFKKTLRQDAAVIAALSDAQKGTILVAAREAVAPGDWPRFHRLLLRAFREGTGP